MTIFAILRVSEPAKVKAALVENYRDDHIDLGASEWMVSDKGTAVDVSNKLKISEGENGIAIIVGVAGYYGRAPTPIWDWMKAKLEASNG
jgi:hypothetical protein